MKLLLIDNYDSFTNNLRVLIYKVLREHRHIFLEVTHNDHITIDKAAQYDGIIISAGPGVPKEAGNICDIILKLGKSKKIFGICLGMQAIAEVYGGQLYHPRRIRHGETAHIQPILPADKLFVGLEGGFEAGLYHSWAVNKNKLPNELEITAFDETGVPMALRHRKYDVCGVQFHPESFLTPCGLKLLTNWLVN